MATTSKSIRFRVPRRTRFDLQHSYSTRSYAEAIEALNTLQSNAAIVKAVKESGRGMNKQAIPEMLNWLSRAGYQAEDFNSLNAIHIAGTKGKGSTAAFVSSILNQYRLPGPDKLVNKVGLYTSPHLRFVRERIQIDGELLSEEFFATSFFEIWNRLEQSRVTNPIPTSQAQNPIYFRYLTMMALHTYLKEKVDAAVIECGMGGEFDSTNVLLSPTVTGITNLGIDHVGMLGSTIESIAWHKAGIMKEGVPAFTNPQPKGAMEVLLSRAQERGTILTVVDLHPQIVSGKAKLGLNGDFQKTNASLAIELAGSYLRCRGKLDLITNPLPSRFLKGLTDVRLGGRCEVRSESDLTWYIDGAHTLESIQVTSQWYSSLKITNEDTFKGDAPTILLFNQQTRAGLPLLEELYRNIKGSTGEASPFTHAIFCSNVTYNSSGYRPDLVSINTDENVVQELAVQKELAAGWKEITGHSISANIFVLPTIEEAVSKCHEISTTWQGRNASANSKPTVLATGSIHLIGGLIDVLEETTAAE